MTTVWLVVGCWSLESEHNINWSYQPLLFGSHRSLSLQDHTPGHLEPVNAAILTPNPALLATDPGFPSLLFHEISVDK